MKFCSTLAFGIFLSAFFIPPPLLGQAFRVSVPEYDVPGGIIKIGRESVSRNVYSLESSTNLLDWSELKGVSQSPLRFTATANRIDIEISAPAASASFFRVRKLPVVDVAAGREFDVVSLMDVNDAGQVVQALGSHLHY